MTKYKAEIVPLNDNKIGTSAHGTATFVEESDQLTITIEMFDTPANTEHWEHFHGFPDGKPADIATAAQDANHDGFVDLMETEAVSGTTMCHLMMHLKIWIFPMIVTQYQTIMATFLTQK